MIVGIGTDIIEIARIRDAIQKYGERFTNRIFTQSEQTYCESKVTSYQHYAVRFAGKEAAFKALGTGLIGKMNWTDLEFVQDELRRPLLICEGEFAKRYQDLNVNRTHVSFSHTNSHAIAVIIFEK